MSPIIIQSTVTGTTLVTFIVSDGDIDTNANYTLTLSDPAQPFAITDNSKLDVNSLLDPLVYDVVVVVTDHGDPPLNSSVTVSVQVEPKNEFDPSIEDSLTFAFDETDQGVGTSFTFTVTDGDEGGFNTPGTADVRLGPSEYSNRFNISSTASNGVTIATLVVTDGFDRETISMFNLTIEAFDTGYSEFRRTSEGTIMVVITDVNDNNPVFEEDIFQASVGENASVNHQFFQLLASDKDTDLDSVLLYSLSDSTNTFGVVSNTGWLQVIGQLNRKEQDEYTLNVTVTDNGGHFDTATVIVTVTEVNDFAPQFVGLPETVTIEENTDYSLNFSVYDNDAEQSGEFVVTMEQDSDVEFFTLDNNVLSLQNQLNYEVCGIVELK